MPEYTYRCGVGHVTSVIHGMTDNPTLVCAICGAPMRRKPQLFNWGKGHLDRIVEIGDKHIENYIRRQKIAKARSKSK